MFTKDDIICNDKFITLVSPKIAFIKHDVFYTPGGVISWRGNTHVIREAPVWITGHSDYGITQSVYDSHKHQTSVWFAVNKEFHAPNLFAYPLGITNDCNDSYIHHIFGNVDIMLDVMAKERDLRNWVYMNFSIGTYRTERQHVFDLFHAKQWVTEENSIMSMSGRHRFLQSIRNHRFVLCPRGNGVDTHRLWETLYMGSIPIVKRHVALEEFTDLPICWIDRWEEVTPEFLQSEFDRITGTTWNLEKLTFGYWKERILSVS